jgi:Tol biopolymer transport system component
LRSICCCALTIVVVLAFGAMPSSGQARPIPVIELPGDLKDMGLSPDGNTIVFRSCSRPSKCGLYEKAVQGGAARLLVSDDIRGEAGNPRWSPDGNWIAFSRSASRHDHSLSVISVKGGVPRRLGSFCGNESSWGVDSQSLVVELYDQDDQCDLGLISSKTGSVIRRFGRHGLNPALSPDGKTLAFVRDGTIRLMGLRELAGKDEILPAEKHTAHHPVWISGGKEILFIAGTSSIAKIAVTPHSPVEVLERVDGLITALDSSRDGKTMIAGVTSIDKWLWRLDVKSAKPRFEKVRQIPWTDDFVTVSSDGRRIAYTSHPSGVWMANFDGSSPRQISEIGDYRPMLSPKGDAVAFTVNPSERNGDTRSFLFVAPTSGGSPQRLLPGRDFVIPVAWSNDSEWVYFVEHKPFQDPQIWKVRPGDGEVLQITHTGGLYGNESPDGKFFYYVGAFDPTVRWVPVDGGKEEVVSNTQVGWWWTLAVGSDFAYFIPESDTEGAVQTLVRQELYSGSVRVLCTLPFEAKWVQLSLDQQTLYAGSEDKPRSSIVLINTH